VGLEIFSLEWHAMVSLPKKMLEFRQIRRGVLLAPFNFQHRHCRNS